MIQLLGALPGAGFSTNAMTPPSDCVGTTPNALGVDDLGERDRRFRAVLVVEVHHRIEVEAGEHVAVADDDAFVDPLGREAHRTRGAERFLLDRISQDDVTELVVTGAVGLEVPVERVGEIAHRQHDLVDTMRCQPRELTFQVRLIGDRQQRLGRRKGQGT